MNRGLPTVPLQPPTPPATFPPDAAVSGGLIPPIERLRLFSDTDWEKFVLEWADSLKEEYIQVVRCGGAGDLGRDVIAICRDDQQKWDNYQCKHYQEPLRPSDIWVELGKLVYYTYRGDYTYPRKYRFVAPHGAGTKLINLFRKPEALRTGLITNWNHYCRLRITQTAPVDLDDKLQAHINSLDFSIFDAIPPLHVIDGHRKTPWFVFRFGGGLPARPKPAHPPAQPAPEEAVYVRHLLDAYEDYLKQTVNTAEDLAAAPDLAEHLADSRTEFYSAESLRAFSRDTLPSGTFEDLQEEVFSGIKDELRANHADGYRRVLAVVKTARTLNPSGHVLYPRLSVRDYGGLCHQLANKNRLRWKK